MVNWLTDCLLWYSWVDGLISQWLIDWFDILSDSIIDVIFHMFVTFSEWFSDIDDPKKTEMYPFSKVPTSAGGTAAPGPTACTLGHLGTMRCRVSVAWDPLGDPASFLWDPNGQGRGETGKKGESQKHHPENPLPPRECKTVIPCLSQHLDFEHINELVGGWATPLKNMKVKWDYCSQYMEK